MREQTKYGIAFLLAVIVGAVAVTQQSFWIDEGAAALKAMQPTLPDWWRALRAEGNSNLQLIFQLWYLWGWEKIFGSSEYALRASNIPFFALAALAMMSIFPRRPRLQWSVFLLTLTNAFLWYYLSEARPYIVLFAFSAITAACLLRLLADETVSISSAWFRLFCLGLIGLCATSLIAVPWAMGAILAAITWLGTRETIRILWRFRSTAAFTAATLVVLAIYYLWTVRIGARASNVGQTETQNVLFVLYELSGLSGLGPGRLALREHGIAAFQTFWPIVALGVLAVGASGVAGWFALWRKINMRCVMFFVFGIVLPFLLVLAAGYTGDMRLLGRHFTALSPFILALLALGLDGLLGSALFPRRILGIFSFAMFAISAAEMRLAPRHQRDDYRSAAAEAEKAIAEGKKVWWAADISTAAYYKVSLHSPGFTAGANLGSDSIDNLPPPDLVFLSRPDIHDAAGKIDSYLRAHEFTVRRTLPAFQIFDRQSTSR